METMQQDLCGRLFIYLSQIACSFIPIFILQFFGQICKLKSHNDKKLMKPLLKVTKINTLQLILVLLL